MGKNLNIIDKDEKKWAKFKCLNNFQNNHCAQNKSIRNKYIIIRYM